MGNNRTPGIPFNGLWATVQLALLPQKPTETNIEHRVPRSNIRLAGLFFLAVGSAASAQTAGEVVTEEAPITRRDRADNDGDGNPDRERTPGRADSNPQGSETSPVRGIDRAPGRGRSRSGPDRNQKLDGTDNNLGQPLMGAAETRLVRSGPVAYADGIDVPAGESRPGARAVSNAVHAQTASVVNRRGYSDFLWQWGQFLDHDIDLTDGAEPPEPNAIAVPAGDPYFDPDGTGTRTIAFNRSLYDPQTGLDADNPRQQINEITAWIDASNVYGSDEDRAAALRMLDGSGQLRTSAGNLLPFNLEGLANAGGPGANLFVAGDVRANEQIALTAMHTLFMREHNRIAQRIAGQDPQASGEQIYQRARREVISLMQIITYNEFLPALLGPEAIAPYEGYDASVNAGIRNEFSTAAYRLGHTMLSPVILRLNEDGTEAEHGHLSLADAFFQPDILVSEGGIEPILRGLAAQACQRIDILVIDEVRNFLFGLPGSGGFDLASLNIQRGRDHGLGSYNQVRVAYGLPALTRMEQITRDPQVVQRLASVYDSVDDVDLWTGGLAESPAPGALVGPLFRAILVEQFTALRDGDRFWYGNVFDAQQLRRLGRTSLADVIRRNTQIGDELADNVFVVN